MTVMGDTDIQIVVATSPADKDNGAQQQQLPRRNSTLSGDLEGSGLGDCARSIVSYASSSIRRSTISYQQRQRRAQWKGIGSRCMWDACRASLFGILLLVSGCIIVLVGYYSEFSSMEWTINFNQTVFLVDPESQKRQKYSYSYIGPVLIGIGVFVLIGVGVATMEMRDMTAKVFPLTKRAPPRKKGHKTSKSKNQLTSLVVGEIFQTPTQRIIKEIATNQSERQRSNFRTVATQTLCPHHPWPWSKLKSSSQRAKFRTNKRGIWRSCQQLCTPSSQQTAVLPPTRILKRRRRRYGYPPNRWIYFRPDSLTLSCPHLDSLS